MLTQEASTALVLREFHHRVANTLTILSASLRRDLLPFDDPRLRDVAARYDQQIMNFGRLFRFLSTGITEKVRSSEAHFRPFIEILAGSILTPIGARCEAFIADALLPASYCEQIALIITELVMNAAKYAFRDCPSGTVRIAIREDKGIWLCSVSDNGVGMMYQANGTGFQIAEALVRTIGGRMIIRSGRWGTQVLVLFPADPIPQVLGPRELGEFESAAEDFSL